MKLSFKKLLLFLPYTLISSLLYSQNNAIFGGGSGDGYSASPLSGVSLPVELSSFGMDCDKGKAQFKWVTNSETNASHFNLLVSDDMLQWNQVERKQAAGYSNIDRIYTTEIENNQLSSFIRLEQVDYDGTVNIVSNIVNTCQNESNTKVLVSGDQTVWIHQRFTDEIQVLDALGRNIGYEVLQITDDGFQLKVQGKSGYYHVRMKNDEHIVRPLLQEQTTF